MKNLNVNVATSRGVTRGEHKPYTTRTISLTCDFTDLEKSSRFEHDLNALINKYYEETPSRG